MTEPYFRWFIDYFLKLISMNKNKQPLTFFLNVVYWFS